MALTATVGGDSSDSYVTIVSADTYFANHFSSTKTADWAALTSTQKESALRRGAQLIDSVRVLDLEYGSGVLPVALREYAHYDIVLHKANVGQTMNFPRNIDVEVDGTTLFIPQPIKDAQCEQALFLINFDDSNLQTYMQGIVTETTQAGPVRIAQTFRQGGGLGGNSGTYIAPIVFELLQPYIRRFYRVRRS